jgi:hypothetical protein
MSSGTIWSRRSVRSALVVVAALLCAALASASPQAVPTKLTLDGVGGVIPGMTEAQVESRWGVKLKVEVFPGSTCGIARLRGYQQYALFERGRLGSVWFRRGGSTGRGIRPGSTRAQLLKAYPRGLRSQPNHYTPGARDYFLRRARKPRWELRFDVSPKGRVVQIAFGDTTVHYIEGCA